MEQQALVYIESTGNETDLENEFGFDELENDLDKLNNIKVEADLEQANLTGLG